MTEYRDFLEETKIHRGDLLVTPPCMWDLGQQKGLVVRLVKGFKMILCKEWMGDGSAGP